MSSETQPRDLWDLPTDTWAEIGRDASRDARQALHAQGIPTFRFSQGHTRSDGKSVVRVRLEAGRSIVPVCLEGGELVMDVPRARYSGNEPLIAGESEVVKG